MVWANISNHTNITNKYLKISNKIIKYSNSIFILRVGFVNQLKQNATFKTCGHITKQVLYERMKEHIPSFPVPHLPSLPRMHSLCCQMQTGRDVEIFAGQVLLQIEEKKRFSKCVWYQVKYISRWRAKFLPCMSAIFWYLFNPGFTFTPSPVVRFWPAYDERINLFREKAWRSSGPTARPGEGAFLAKM